MAPLPRPAVSWPGGARSRAVQGVFQSRPFSFAAINPGAVQKKPSIQLQSGVDAFQVDLRPKSGGWPLPRDVQAKMEAALGANFSDVRIHVGPEASAIGAIAFTWGSDLYFAPGQYNPHTPHGQFLLGHELQHVVQQRAGRVANPFGSSVAVVQDQALEAEADRLGRLAASSRPPEPASSAGSSAANWSGAGRVGTATINMKPQEASYAVRAPRPSGSGWEISVAAQGMQQPVGSLQMTPSEKGIVISNLKVAPEHRRHGLAGQLIDAAVRSARNRGYPVAQLEARPDSAADVTPGALFSMYQRYGFRMTGRSHRGNPLMERTT